MENTSPIHDLFRRYLDGTVSETDIDLLLSYFKDKNQEGDLRAIIASELQHMSDEADNRWQGPVDESFSKIKSMMTARKGAIRHLLFWKVAAAIIVLIGASFIWRFIRTSRKDAIPVPYATIVPGGNHAILTLADGRKVTLDSQAIGRIGEANGMSITKLDSGRLAYAADGELGGTGRGQAGADRGQGGTDRGPGGKSSLSEAYNVLTTPRGGQYQVLLPDGTRAWLNNASSIKYPLSFNGPERRVEITGEVYFDVAKNGLKPFLVLAGDMKVQVLGTEFNLMAYPDEGAIRTTLIKGSLRVVAGEGSRLVKPGQQAVLERNQAGIGIVNPDLQEVLAWKENKFRFHNASISQIMRQLARWYDVDIIYEGDPPAFEFNGVLPRKQNVTEILDVLTETRNVHFLISGRKIIVKPGEK